MGDSLLWDHFTCYSKAMLEAIKPILAKRVVRLITSRLGERELQAVPTSRMGGRAPTDQPSTLLQLCRLIRMRALSTAALVSLAVVSAIVWSQISPTRPSLARAAFAPFDATRPGYGIDLVASEPTDQPMAYALYALAAAELGDAARAKIAADWLVANSRQSKGIGWGINWPWDAFSDHSVNPADTIYGITVALAVRALLDTNEIAPNEAYIVTARAALDTYATSFVPTETGGFFPYSLEPADRKDTHNVNAALAGLYARVSVMQDEPVFRDLAKKAAHHVWANRIEKDSEVWWPYSEVAPRPNDAVHASYIVDGLLGVARAVGFDEDLRPAVKHLKSFARNGKVYTMPDVPGLSMKAREHIAHLWGAGMLLYALIDAGEREAAEAMLPAIQAYETTPGVYGLKPDDHRFVPRHQGHLVWGLARLERGGRV